MKVKLKVTAAGPEGVMFAGEIHEVSAALGAGLIRGGYAELVKPDPTPDPSSKGEWSDDVIETAVPVLEERTETSALPAPAIVKPKRGKRP